MGITDALRISGGSLLKLGKTEEARELLGDALDTARKRQYAQGAAQAAECLAELELKENRFSNARPFLEAAISIYESMNNTTAVKQLREQLSNLP